MNDLRNVDLEEMDMFRRLCAVFLICPFAGLVIQSAGAAVPAPEVADAPATKPTLLPRGRTPGTFHLAFRGRVTFSIGDCFPANVAIKDPLGEKLSEIEITDGRRFLLEADLLPGSYIVASELTRPNAEAEYEPYTYHSIFIDRDGKLNQERQNQVLANEPENFVHVRTMTGLSPSDCGVATSDKPVMSWASVAGAVRYRGVLMNDGLERFDVKEALYASKTAVQPERLVFWQVAAFAKDGRMLAASNADFFGLGTDPGYIAKTLRRKDGESCPLPRLPVGPGYLGTRVMASRTASNPADMEVHLDAKGQKWVGFRGKEASSIRLTDLMPGSPAVAAGLQPDDEILAIDGQPIEVTDSGSADVPRFLKKIGETKPDTVVKLKARRGAEDLEVAVTVAKVPATLHPHLLDERP